MEFNCEELGRPVVINHKKLSWLIPKSVALEHIIPILKENNIQYENNIQGLIITDPFSILKLIEIFPFEKCLLTEKEGPKFLVGAKKDTLLLFISQYGFKKWTFNVSSYGCAQNQAEGENIKSFLKLLGGNPVSLENSPDILIFNTCAVKKPTEDRMIQIIKDHLIENKNIIVSGCLPMINPKRVLSLSRDIKLSSPNPVPSILDAIVYEQKDKPSRRSISNIPLVEPVFHNRNKLSAMFPIAQGCVGACTFCAVKFARGFVKSYSIESIISLAKRAIERGAKEIWLTSQDTAAYGLDWKNENKRLPDLISQLINIEGDFKIRIGMMSPDTLIPILDDMIEMLNSPKVYRFLHLPVQSGSNDVLGAMNRYYTIEEYVNLVKKLRTVFPDITIMTDLIVGFPGETEEDHNASIELLKKLSFDVVNVSRYGDRPGTKASKMKNKVPTHIAKKRSVEITKIVNEEAEKRNRFWLGWEGEALIVADTLSKDLIARNYAYKPIVIRHGKIGEKIKVRISGYSFTSLFTD